MLSICEGGSVITLDQVEARDKLRIVSDAGARLPIYCTSQGKVFLAHMPRAQAEKLLRRQSKMCIRDRGSVALMMVMLDTPVPAVVINTASA